MDPIIVFSIVLMVVVTVVVWFVNKHSEPKNNDHK